LQTHLRCSLLALIAHAETDDTLSRDGRLHRLRYHLIRSKDTASGDSGPNDRSSEHDDGPASTHSIGYSYSPNDESCSFDKYHRSSPTASFNYNRGAGSGAGTGHNDRAPAERDDGAQRPGRVSYHRANGDRAGWLGEAGGAGRVDGSQCQRNS
jgi:hypothetical protein